MIGIIPAKFPIYSNKKKGSRLSDIVFHGQKRKKKGLSNGSIDLEWASRRKFRSFHSFVRRSSFVVVVTTYTSQESYTAAMPHAMCALCTCNTLPLATRNTA